MSKHNQEKADRRKSIDALASKSSKGLVAEFWAFLGDNKKWWLLPILFTLLIMGTLVALSGTVAAPFVYTLF